MSVRIYTCKWIVPDISIQVQALRIGEDGVGNRVRLGAPVGRGESAQRRRVVPCQKVVIARFGVAFFAGEVMFGGGGNRTGATQPVAEGQAGAGLLEHAGVVSLRAAGAQRVGEVEVQAVGIDHGRDSRYGLRAAAAVVGGDERAGGVDVGVQPCHGVVGVHGHLGDLLAAGAEDIVVGGLEVVDGRIAATHVLNGAFGHARAVGIVEVAGHHRHAGDGGAGHSADAPLGVIKILVLAVVEPVAGCVVRYAAERLAGGCELVVGVVVGPTGERQWSAGAGRGGDGLRKAVAEGVVAPAAVVAGIGRGH